MSDESEFEEGVIEPLQAVRDHLRWLHVTQRDGMAGLLYEQIEADLRMARTLKRGRYPRKEGDITVLGPEIFASRDGSVLSWKGNNYVPQPPGDD
jgi:hypothetical protein